jgi:hypothetical protein
VVELFATGRVVDCILAFMLIELSLLTIIRRKRSKGPSLFELIVGLAAGMALLLALRAALAGARWQSVAVWLAVALGAHLWDLRLRWAAS